MKHFLTYFFFVFYLFLNNNSLAGTKGTGEVKLSETSLYRFADYLSGKIVKGARWNPMFFVLSSDGEWSGYYYCPYSQCQDGDEVARTIETCERETGIKCGLFARKRNILWDNGTNVSRKKKKFNSKWDIEKIKSQLIELGFYGGSYTQEEEKETSESKDEDSITKQLTKLIELYESGRISKEEFEKAKDKILN
tara:strand:+ start:2022 stop:2603 length:582 start_codon:yes stop_codon:yes gene_type:complete